MRCALRDTSEAVGANALNHGFNHLSFFNRLLRREFARNPSAYSAAGLSTAGVRSYSNQTKR